MTAAQFKAKCLELMDEVATTGEPVIVTKRGKPVAQLTPIIALPKSLRGFWKGSVRSRGDIVEPIDVRWDVEKA